MRDISTKSDIELLVDTFYGFLFADEEMSVFFKDIDFEHHKPRIVFFWSFVLLNEPGYTTNVFEKHVHMPLKPEHFDRWVMYFHKAVDQLFEGEIANDAKFRATTLGWTFKEKMKKIDLDREKHNEL